MTPDKKQPGDEEFIVEGYVFVIEKDLARKLGPEITIDYKNGVFNKGFQIYR